MSDNKAHATISSGFHECNAKVNILQMEVHVMPRSTKWGFTHYELDLRIALKARRQHPSFSLQSAKMAPAAAGKKQKKKWSKGKGARHQDTPHPSVWTITNCRRSI